MSVVGLSPSDIVNGVLVVSQGLQALKVKDGSKERFQHTSQNTRLRIDALTALDDFAISQGAGSFSDSVRYAVKELLEQDLEAKAKLDKYNSSLGQQAPVGRRRGIPAKLKWAFSGAQDQTERYNRSVSGIDAAILRLILLDAEASRQRDNEHSASLAAAELNIRSQIGIHTGDAAMKVTNSENIICACLDENAARIQRNTELCTDKTSATLADLGNRNRAQWDQNQAEINSIRNSLSSISTGLFNEPKNDIDNHDAHAGTLEQKLTTILDSQQNLVKANLQLHDTTEDIKYLCHSLLRAIPAQNPRQSFARSCNDAQKRAEPSTSRKQQQMKLLPEIRTDIIKGSVLTLSCILYGHPSIKRAARALVGQMSLDPILALLVILAGYFFGRHLSNTSIPLSIGGQHTLRSTDPFVTWPQTNRHRIRVMLSRPSRVAGTLYIFSASYGEGVVKIGYTRRDVSSRLSAWGRKCGMQPQLKFLMAEIQNVRIAHYLLFEELRSSRRKQLCKVCRRRHNELFEVDVQAAVKVISQILEWTKTISLEGTNETT